MAEQRTRARRGRKLHEMDAAELGAARNGEMDADHHRSLGEDHGLRRDTAARARKKDRAWGGAKKNPTVEDKKLTMDRKKNQEMDGRR